MGPRLPLLLPVLGLLPGLELGRGLGQGLRLPLLLPVLGLLPELEQGLGMCLVGLTSIVSVRPLLFTLKVLSSTGSPRCKGVLLHSQQSNSSEMLVFSVQSSVVLGHASTHSFRPCPFQPGDSWPEGTKGRKGRDKRLPTTFERVHE